MVIGSFPPVTDDYELYLIHESDIHDLHNEISGEHHDTLFPVISSTRKRSRVNNPTFSRPLADISELSDEDIIHSQIRFNG